MDNYITQEIKIDEVQGAKILNISLYVILKDGRSMSSYELYNRYGHSTTVLYENCEYLALTNNGVLYDNRSGKIILPEVMFNDDTEIGVKAIFHFGDETIDLGELLLKCRFRLDPDNFKISYRLKTDGKAIFIDSLIITFKEPVMIKATKSYDFQVVKFFNEYFISRLDEHIYVSTHGAIYDGKRKKFLPIYIERVFSHEDKCYILQATIYSGEEPIPLLSYIIDNWSGVHIPQGYKIMNTSPIITNTDLQAYAIRNYSNKKIFFKLPVDRNKLIKRDEQHKKLIKRVETAISRTWEIIKKAEKKQRI